MWLGRDPAIIRDPACIAYLIYTAPASKQDPALIWNRLINGHIRYMYIIYIIYIYIYNMYLYICIYNIYYIFIYMYIYNIRNCERSSP